MKENSPFTPGNPVPLEFFVGRIKQIEEILKYAKEAKHGRLENVFLIGERGIGKSSLGAFLRYYLSVKEDFLTVYVSSGGITTLKELIRCIFEQILIEGNTETTLKRLFDKFKKYIQEIGLLGISLVFRPPDDELEEIVKRFPQSIKNIVEMIRDKKEGIFIILDDINGLSKTSDFANWYKSFVDTVAIRYPNFPVFIMLIGLPEVKDSLTRHQPSLMRIFRVINIDKLSDDEVKEFFEKTFKKVNMEVTQKAKELMIKFSSGLPVLMHEIGDAIFWKDEDGRIDENDAIDGIIEAANRIGTKYLSPKVYRTIRSERYRSILRKLGERLILKSFKKVEIENKLNEKEKKVFNHFLKKMRELGVIIPDIEGARGAYKFANMLYPVYIWMESQYFCKGHKMAQK